MLSTPVAYVPGFDELGILAFTTTRQTGSFNLTGTEPAADVYGRWLRLIADVAPRTSRFASSHQVHGVRIAEHLGGWSGWLRAFETDGHIAVDEPTGLAVSLADCVPLFIAHPSGAGAVLHAGWRGTAAGILAHGVRLLSDRGLSPADLVVHLGPSICGNCYEVGPDVYEAVTGRPTSQHRTVDLRDVLAGQARGLGIGRVTVDDACTRCHNERFYSHRAGDEGRQLGVLVTTRI